MQVKHSISGADQAGCPLWVISGHVQCKTAYSLCPLEPFCEKLGRRATLKLFADADHSFHVPARTGRKDTQVLGDVLHVLAAWLDSVTDRPAKKS